MSRQVFIEMLSENRFIDMDEMNSNQLIFLDNVSGQDVTEEVQQTPAELRTSLYYLPPNYTHKVQPLDTGIFAQFKKVWQNEW